MLTSLDQHMLTDHLGVNRDLSDHMVKLSQLAIDCGLNGVVCSAQEVASIRRAIGREGVIVTPGIRPPSGEVHDQKRTGTPNQALEDGSDYLVIGRALSDSLDVEATLASLGFSEADIRR